MKSKKSYRLTLLSLKSTYVLGLMLSMLLVCNASLYSQNESGQSTQKTLKSIKGNVVGSNTEPLIGVTIVVVGKPTGAVTDRAGNYTINVAPGSQLKFSYIGYNDYFVTVGNQSVIDVALSENSSTLDEVVVIGYGSQKKETLTGAVSVVSDKMLKDKGTVASPLQALQGQVPGVIITRKSSAPGDESWGMNLRGAVSRNSPGVLVIIDGVESDDFGSINPSDIESINFLKDASAAIYGSKAAGGVVIVTTKKAKMGRTKVEYNGSVTGKFKGLSPTLMTLDEWADGVTAARINDGYGVDDWWIKYTALAKANKGSYIDFRNSTNPIVGQFTNVADIPFFETDWQDILWGTAVSTSHELAVSGGSERATYRLSMRYMYDGSPLQWGNNNNQRYNFRLNNTFKLSDKFNIESTISYNRQDQVKPSQISKALTASTEQPGFPSSTKDGKPYAWGDWGTANWYCELGGDNMLKSSGINITETFNYQIYKDLKMVGTVGYNTSTSSRDIKSQSIDFYNYAGDIKVNTMPTQKDTYYSKTFARTDLYDLSAYLNWTKTLAENHNFSAMLGVQYNFREYERSATMAEDILAGLDVINGSGNVTLQDPDKTRATKYQEALLSYYSRLNYNYKSKYLLEVNLRYDGSSKFQPENRWSFFYGLSGGWRISQEDFMRSVKFVDELKLRASYGTVGNQAGIDRYDGVQLYNFYPGTGPFIGGGLSSYINTNGKLVSANRTWEVIQNYNLGLDFGLLSNRLTGAFELFMKKCDNMLITVTYPGVLGDTAPTGNYGKFETKGWEGTLTWSDKIGKVSYYVGGTFTNTSNKLIDNGGDAAIKAGVVSNREGYPLNSVFGLRYTGKIQNEAQMKKYTDRYMENNKIGMPSTIRLGDNMFEDVNGDGELTPEDYVYLGSDDPKISFSFTAGVEWKGLSIACVFQGAGKRTIFRDSSNETWRVPIRQPYMNTTNQSVGNVWSNSTPNAHFPRYTNKADINTYNYQCSSWSVEDGSYLRLKSVTVGYSLPEKLMAKTKTFSAARVYFTGSDLWENSKINDGWDPEATRTVSATGRFPFTRNITFGLSLTF